MDVFSVIDRLLFRETMKTLLVILSVLALVLVATTMVKLLGKVAVGGLAQDLVLILAGLELVKVLGMLLPPAFFFSILWVLGRMYRDSEMVALQAAGVGAWRIFRAFMLSAVPLALFVTWLVFEVLPWAKLYSEQIKLAEEKSGELSMIRAGHFNEFSQGDLVIYAERLDKESGQLRNLFVQERLSGHPGLISALGARQYVDPPSGRRYVVMTQGHRFEDRGEQGMALGDFDEYGFLVPEAPPLDADILPLSARDARDLLESSDPRDRAELQYRLTFPLAIFAFTLLSIPLSRSLPRQGLMGRFGLAVLIYFIFMNLQRVAERWLSEGVTPAWLGMWWLPGLLVVAALLVMWWDRWAFRRALRGTPA